MIVWLNGAFGAGKTTTARLLEDALPARLFDAEHIGFLLRPIIGDIPHQDFKEWPPWRALTVETARHLLDFVGGTLVIPQSVLQHHYWTELMDGFARHDIPVHAFTLHADRDAFHTRVEADTDEPAARQWRLDHRDAYERALGEWMSTETTVIDTTHRTPDQTAAHITAALNSANHETT
ncbi:AAA family ATPase [Glycomyces sp. TRM65418]|uniref:AAA family ATPase n=1 Tax=Glycomyces sp. TRM65418 TaxID=2867006 RepID=UPI001CE6BF83|nr:AAA family ATPase [Glycomyces sp. TRM65418]MCC3763265.1 AAA family ATPase [Glycomyces sp. TRM65418]QZD57266.1 AAA family ATPase [Glycomyces sp. TRM65418]